MDIINFDSCIQNNRMYGGLSGAKIGVVYADDNYIIKFPKNLREAGMKNVVLSYSNSPICEYLGSHIYEIIGVDVHKTLLGTRKGKNVVACKDFLNRGDRLYEFREIKTTLEPNFTDNDVGDTSGNGTDLEEIMTILSSHPLLKKMAQSQILWDRLFALLSKRDISMSFRKKYSSSG